MAALEPPLCRTSTTSIVDLTARAYDGIAAIAAAHAAGRPVLAVGQHDDVALRRRALAAGADRVLRIGSCSRTAHASSPHGWRPIAAVESPA